MVISAMGAATLVEKGIRTISRVATAAYVLAAPNRQLWGRLWEETGEDDVDLTLLYPLDERIFARWE